MIPEEQEMTEKKAESQTEKEEDIEDISIKDAKEPEQVQEATESQQSKEEEEREQLERVSGYTLRTVRPDTNHSVTMPDITSHYFLLQKNSKKVNAASGGNLAVVADANAASKYIYESYSNGKQYNFTASYTSPNCFSGPFFTVAKETPPPLPPPTVTVVLLVKRGVKLYCV